MPKIPTFTNRATITAETGSVQTNIQMGLSNNFASALAPVTKEIAEYKIKEKNAENKTEALELENEAIVELNGYVKEASNFKDTEKANKYLMEKSNLLRSKYENRASSKIVKTIFANNYLMEEQKKIYAVDNAVHQNLINSRLLLSSAKEERIMTDALYPASGDNSMALATLSQDLTSIYKSDFDDGIISITEYEERVSNIPNKIDYFKAKKDLVDDPVETFRKLNTGEYENLNLETRNSLLKESLSEVREILKENITNYEAGLEVGIEVPINKPAIKEAFGNEVYKNFLETEKNIMRTSETRKNIMNAKQGTEQEYVDNFSLDSGNLAEDLKYKQKVQNYLTEKNELIENDAATLIIQNNSIVKSNFENYQNEPEGESKNKLFKKYVNSVVDAQKEMDLDPSLIKVIPENFAKKLVRDYESRLPEEKIAYLQGLEEQYGDQYGIVLNQLSNNGLPITAKLVSYLNDENFAIKAMSVDSEKEKEILDNFLERKEISKTDIKVEVFDKMKDLRDTVMVGNKMNTTKANQQLEDIYEVITYVAINAMSSGTPQKKAIEEATSSVMSKFRFAGDDGIFGGKKTYFIPKNYNNKTLSDGQMKFVEEKASIIKKHYLDKFDMFSFKSDDPENDKLLDEEMLEQAKENGIWVNSADGSGIVFAIPFPDGSLGLVENKKGELLEVKFDDDSHALPNSNILLDITLKNPGRILEEKSIYFLD